MSGYNPAFSDIYMGTLYGRWPAAAVWATLIPLIDQNGRIDMSIQAIAGMTGWPLDLLEEGIKQLMEPDKNSRTAGNDGRRLVPIDPSRPWGWVAVNHSKYREKARLLHKNAKEKSERRSNSPVSAESAESAENDMTPPEYAGIASQTQEQEHLKIGHSFDRFWQAYPKRVKKKPALEIWKRKQLDSQVGVLVSDVIRRQKEDRRWREGFIPDPTTYLNQERWNDEIEAERKRGGNDFQC